jgi:hypothetical protein
MQKIRIADCFCDGLVIPSLTMPAFSDPFCKHRETSEVMKCPFHGEEITMILSHDGVRKAARDWQTFSSDAPFRVPIPSEESVRGMRQLPIETDPPLHGEYRELVEPFFQRAKQPEVMQHIEPAIPGFDLSFKRAGARGGNMDRLGSACIPARGWFQKIREPGRIPHAKV